MTLDVSGRLAPLIGLGVFAAVMIFRFSKARKARPLKLEWMWVLPAFLMLATGALLWQMPPRGLEWLWLVLASAIGGAVGWQRGRMMQITVDPQSHALNQQASPAALMLLVALVAVRYALHEGLSAEAQAWHLSAAFLTDVFVVFAMALLTVARLEMFLRARRLLAHARAPSSPG